VGAIDGGRGDIRFDFSDKKFADAARTLTETTGSIQERLQCAFINHLMYLDLRDLPAAIHREFAEFREGMIAAIGDDNDALAMSAEQAHRWGASKRHAHRS
jgi:hypothetical protein